LCIGKQNSARLIGADELFAERAGKLQFVRVEHEHLTATSALWQIANARFTYAVLQIQHIHNENLFKELFAANVTRQSFFRHSANARRNVRN
jgi:hypothetical protein